MLLHVIILLLDRRLFQIIITFNITTPKEMIQSVNISN